MTTNTTPEAAHDWDAAIAEFEGWLVTDVIDEKHLNAAIAALKEMKRRDEKRESIKEIMKS